MRSFFIIGTTSRTVTGLKTSKIAWRGKVGEWMRLISDLRGILSVGSVQTSSGSHVLFLPKYQKPQSGPICAKAFRLLPSWTK